jgi:polysaccharide export outer membrane protein
MESGTSSHKRSKAFFLPIVATAVLVIASGAGAQQAASPAQNPPAETTAGQSAPQSGTPTGTPATPQAAAQSTAQPASATVTVTAAPSGVPPQTADTAKDTGEHSQEDQSVVKLGPGDLIELNVYNVPELTTKARVSNSGDVYLPLVDYVHVGGLTQEEAQGVIEKRLEEGGFVRSPHVTIFVDEANSQGVTVLGEVTKPGIYPDPADRKLYQVISEAGGFTPSASRKIAVIRPSLTEPIRVELPRNLADDLAGNIDVLPGDTITIPKAPIIYVVGDVGRPSGLLVDNGTLTVLQALALAGGTNRTAKMSGARIIRKGGPTGMTETPLQLKKMLEAKSPDITLQGDDILFVPVSGGRVLAGRSFEAAMSLATTLTVYTVRP